MVKVSRRGLGQAEQVKVLVKGQMATLTILSGEGKW